MVVGRTEEAESFFRDFEEAGSGFNGGGARRIAHSLRMYSVVAGVSRRLPDRTGEL